MEKMNHWKQKIKRFETISKVLNILSPHLVTQNEQAFCQLRWALQPFSYAPNLQLQPNYRYWFTRLGEVALNKDQYRKPMFIFWFKQKHFSQMGSSIIWLPHMHFPRRFENQSHFQKGKREVICLYDPQLYNTSNWHIPLETTDKVQSKFKANLCSWMTERNVAKRPELHSNLTTPLCLTHTVGKKRRKGWPSHQGAWYPPCF